MAFQATARWVRIARLGLIFEGLSRRCRGSLRRVGACALVAILGCPACRARASEGPAAAERVTAPERKILPSTRDLQSGREQGIPLGPTLLGVGGGALLGTTLALGLKRDCNTYASNGECLRGERLSGVLMGTLIGSSALALGGAVVWWMLDADDNGAPKRHSTSRTQVGLSAKQVTVLQRF